MVEARGSEPPRGHSDGLTRAVVVIDLDSSGNSESTLGSSSSRCNWA